MLKTAFLALLALAAQPQGSNAFFTGGSSGNLRMIGGDVVTDPNSYSFQVAIRPSYTPTGSSNAVNVPPCSGVLIEGEATSGVAYFILTSATCVSGGGEDFRVWAGTNEVRLSTAVTATFKKADVRITVHPEFYTSGMTSSDLAIIAAPQQITAIFANVSATPRLSTARLPTIDNASQSYLAYNANMAGWGYPNDVFDAPSTRLRQLNSRVVPNLYCSAIHFGKPISNRHICTGGLINKGPCTGDSGAPLIIQDSNGESRVVGLATLVPSNGCSKGKPGVFTRLGHYLSWIVSVTGYNAEL